MLADAEPDSEGFAVAGTVVGPGFDGYLLPDSALSPFNDFKLLLFADPLTNGEFELTNLSYLSLKEALPAPAEPAFTPLPK